MTGSGGHDEPAATLLFRVTPTILVGWARLLVPTATAKGFAPGCAGDVALMPLSSPRGLRDRRKP